MKNSAITNNFNSNEKAKSLISTSAKEALAELSNFNPSKSNLNILVSEKTNDCNISPKNEKNK